MSLKNYQHDLANEDYETTGMQLMCYQGDN
jgi:hypothetical protein